MQYGMSVSQSVCQSRQPRSHISVQATDIKWYKLDWFLKKHGQFCNDTINFCNMTHQFSHCVISCNFRDDSTVNSHYLRHIRSSGVSCIRDIRSCNNIVNSCYKTVNLCHKIVNSCYKIVNLCYKTVNLCYKTIVSCLIRYLHAIHACSSYWLVKAKLICLLSSTLHRSMISCSRVFMEIQWGTGGM